MKNKKRNKRNNKGFTLVELLATIAILSILVTIGLYLSTDTLNVAKRKSYEVTINNVEKNANTYVTENKNKIFYLTSSDGKREYQCVTISNLIEMGYLDANVVNSPINSEGDKLDENDYIYIERDAQSKTLLKSVYNREGDYNCEDTIKATGDITFIVNPSMNVWSREKTITINYKVKNRQSASTYQYTYAINSSTSEIAVNNSQTTITLDSPTTINAKIMNGEDSLITKTLYIGLIDDIKPSISLTDTTISPNFNGTAKIPISVIDNESGVNGSTIDKTDFKVTIGGASVSLASLKLTKLSETTSVIKYELEITDTTHRGALAVKIPANNIFDNVENGNLETTLPLDVVMNQVYKVTADARGGTIAVTTGWTGTGASATKNVTFGEAYGGLPTTSKVGYNLDGWYSAASSGDQITTTTTVTKGSNHTIYAHWTAKKYTITLNKNGGTNTPTASIQATYGTKTLTPGSITLPEKKYTVSGFALADARNSTGATVSSSASLTVTNAFAGWYSASSGGSLVMSKAASPVLQANIEGYTGASGFWTKVGNATLYAQYTAGSVKLPTITKAGYTCGWTTSSAGKTIVYASGGSIAPTGNTTLYGVCEGKPYTITLNKNGGTNTPTASVSVTYGTKTLTPGSITLPEKKYTVSGFALADARNSTGATVSSSASLTVTNAFAGWYSASSGGSLVMSKAASPVLQANIEGYTGASGFWTKVGNATLYAQYTAGSVKLPTITKAGYTCGWTTSSAGKTIVYASGGSIAPTGNTTLYGVCEGKPYTITLNKNGGTNTPTASVSVTYGTKTLTPGSITLPEKKYTVSGFALADARNSTGATVSSSASLTVTNAFAGWYSASSGGSLVMSKAASPVLQANIEGYTGASGFWTKVGNATLYAQYTAGSVKLPTITKSGYKCGWTTNSTGKTIVYASGGSIVPTGNTTLYGVCEGNSYTITLNKNGSTNTPTASVNVTYGAKTLSPSTITIGVKSYKVSGFNTSSYRDSTGASISSTASLTANYTFNGWYSASSGGYQVITATNTPSLKANVTGYTGASGIWEKAGNATLYAQFTSVSVKLPTISKSGYTCGWTNDSYGTEIKYSSGAKYTPTQDVTLYAVCEVEEIVVTAYDSYRQILRTSGWTGSGSSAMKLVAYGDTYGTLPEVNDSTSCDDYEFIGWYTSQYGGTRIRSTTTMTSSYDHTIYARYEYNGDCCTNHYYCNSGGSYSSKTGYCTASNYKFSGSGQHICASNGYWQTYSETNQSCSSGFTKSYECGEYNPPRDTPCVEGTIATKKCVATCTWNGDYKPKVVCE